MPAQLALRTAPVQYEAITLKGGLDLISPTLSLAPGVARDALNFEASTSGGYTRIAGYERYDGQTAPSAATYTLLTVTYSGTIALGTTVNGQTSSATGVVIATTATTLTVTAVSGTFTTGENLRDGVTVFAVLDAITGSSSNGLQHAAYTALAAAHYRALIAKPTGSGAVRGVFTLGGSTYCFRNNAGGTAAVMFKASGSGWTSVALGRELSFTSGGTTEIAEGDTITGATSGATAVVTRVTLESGTWAAGTAAGRFIFASQTGTFQAENINVGATLNLATIGGDSSAITLDPDGRFEIDIGTVGGTARAYGCDTVNRGWEFDGTVFVPIDTGMTDDTPDHVKVHKNHLFFSFGSSVQHSSIGYPYAWSPVTGASEIAVGDTLTNFVELPGSQQGGALLMQTRNDTSILYGSSSSDWNLVNYNNGIGALAYTAQNMAGVYALDDRGVMGLNQSLAYGNFEQASLTANIRPFIQENRRYATASTVCREKSQYRVFFSNGYGLFSTIVNDRHVGSMPVFFPDPVYCAWNGEDANGDEVILVGSTAGYVYQLEKGTSFDGDPIPFTLTLNYDAIKGPRILKRYRKAAVEVTGDGYAAFGFTYSLGYGSSEYAPQASATYASNFAITTWDSGATWDSGLVWDGRTLIPSEVELAGTAENIALTFSGNADYMSAFTINTVIIHYSPRRGMR